MKQLRYFFAIAASALMMVACQKDVDIDNGYAFGETLKLRFEVPALQVVDITRGAVEETEAYNVMVYIFDGAGNRAVAKNITLTPTNEDSYSRKYEVDTEIQLPKADTYDIYAIANTEGNSLWDGADKFYAATTKSDFEKVALTLTTVENPSNRMTLSGYTTFTASDAVNLAADIKMTRPYAKVTFNVKSGSVNPNFKFTPTSYNIYNVPTKASMFDVTESLAGEYKSYENRAIGLNGTFEFIQMENAFNIVEGPAKYADREKRVSDTDRAFDYAPENSTYVVIYGDGVETDGNGNIKKISKTNYTIHLGDFSASGDMGNFSVERNTHYTYNVTVNGVNMVEVEARKEEGNYENGAEGYVIDLSKSPQVYTLDAHYETVLLKLDITNTSFGDGDSELNGLTLSVSTPMMADTDKNVNVSWTEINEAIKNETLDAFYQKYDAKWVEFMPVATANFAAYKSSPMFYACEFLNEIFKEKTAPDANNVLTVVKENGIDYIYVVAFVNEYYYDDVTDWTLFVNKPEREMKILQSPDVSRDGHSIYSQALCVFQQKSISTMFNYIDPSKANNNVFGIEMYDETGALDINTSNAGSSLTNGRANMTSYINGGQWSAIVGNGGYDYNGQPNGNSYNVLVKAISNTNTAKDAAYACMQRNRDVNGDGTIDDDEIRWYMPALGQYSAFWYGEEALPTYARLFQGNTTDVKSLTDYEKLSHYYTSTNEGSRIFWAIEGSSYGDDNTTWQGNTHNTRCVRNLVSVSSAPATTVTKEGNYLVVNNFNESAYRTTTQNGQYPAHHEREIANKLPKAFKVAKSDLSGRGSAVSTVLKAPQISSAKDNGDGTTTLTFAAVDGGAIGYYYATRNSTSNATKLEIVNNQVTIPVSINSEGPAAAPAVSATYSGSTLTITLDSRQDGWEYYYTRNTTFATTNQIFNGNNSASITYSYSYNSRDFYVWAYNPTTGANSLYTRVRVSRNYMGGSSYSTDITEQTNTSGGISTIYVWAYDQGLTQYSNATTITNSGVTIGADKTATSSTPTSGYSRYAATTQDLCASYTETSDPDNAPKWRVPNQRELTAMSEFATAFNLSTTYSCTQFSNAVNVSSSSKSRYSYLFDGSRMTLQGSETGGAIRCVRDLASDEVAKDESTDGDMGDGGGI